MDLQRKYSGEEEIEQNWWHCQYLEQEKLYYLTEQDDSGILFEGFYGNELEMSDFINYKKIKTNGYPKK